jgi:hypothetical protein
VAALCASGAMVLISRAISAVSTGSDLTGISQLSAVMDTEDQRSKRAVLV